MRRGLMPVRRGETKFSSKSTRTVISEDDLCDSVHFLKTDAEWANVFDWLRSINADVFRAVFYDDFWSVAKDEPSAPPPIEFVEDLVQFVLFAAFPETEKDIALRDIGKAFTLAALLRALRELNCDGDDDEKRSDDEKEAQLESEATRMSRRSAEIFIDFLRFGAMSYRFNAERPRWRNALKVLQCAVEFAAMKKCREREASVRLDIAECLKELKRFESAVTELKEALKIAEAMRPKQIEIGRAAALMHCEILDLHIDDEKRKEKEALIANVLRGEYSLSAELKYRDAYHRGNSSRVLRCAYAAEFEPVKVTMVPST